jgi:ribosomal protein S27AE
MKKIHLECSKCGSTDTIIDDKPPNTIKDEFYELKMGNFKNGIPMGKHYVRCLKCGNSSLISFN